MKKYFYIGFLLLLFSLFSRTECFSSDRLDRKELSKHRTIANQPARASPTDTTDFSVQIYGDSNIVKINGKIVKSTTDTLPKKNSVQVSGEGNTVNVMQNDHASEVSVSQRGKNNHVIITQKK